MPYHTYNVHMIEFEWDKNKAKSNLKKHVGKDNAEGHFGFCGHSDAVSFRDIKIRRL